MKIREQEVAAREANFLQFVEALIMLQANAPRPIPKKRKGKFSRQKALKNKEQIISGPIGKDKEHF